MRSFPNQGWNPDPRIRSTESWSLDHQRSPLYILLIASLKEGARKKLVRDRSVKGKINRSTKSYGASLGPSKMTELSVTAGNRIGTALSIGLLQAKP